MYAWKLAATLALAALCRADARAQLSFSSMKEGTSSDDTARPGICKDTPECAKGFECVALQTNRDATVAVKQCLPKENEADVCAGQLAGLCPTFSSWKSPYNAISSVCTYKPAENCANGTTTESVKGELMCVAGAKDASGKKIDVIYGCVDFDPKAKKLLFGDSDAASKLSRTLQTADALVESCLDTSANSTSGLLCAGQGTCLPTAVGQLSYKCKCNVGYAGDYCGKVVSNKCALPGQCATGVCNLTTKECECAAGTTGPQCSECDTTSEKACNSKGKCSAKACVCDDGWEGLQCTKQVKKTVKAANSTSDITASANTSLPLSAAAPAAASSVAAAFTLATVLIAAALN
ncbi:hypothetical protein PybrP1_006818 [[Pythium] brassicae (nom. inval.)]|nr:hypothetical protein PybrP1_006818 [[Pythium] brassicae (nom. inval.)]